MLVTLTGASAMYGVASFTAQRLERVTRNFASKG